jgi:protoporphyrinogen IX oxidase
MTWLATAYPWVKAAHLFAVVAWMAGLLYLPRLFVYHAAAARGSETAETLAVMERRLLRGIMNPAMIATWVLGIALALTPDIVDWHHGWIYVKLAAVAGLTEFHQRLARWRKALADGSDAHAPRFFRFVNEIPTLLLLLILIMVVVRPF